MPYKIKGKCIYKKDTSKKVGCTTGSVQKYMKALHTNVHESFDTVVLRYLSEMDSTQNSTNPLGATTTGKFTSTITPTTSGSAVPANVDLSTLDDKNITHIKDACNKMGKPYNNVTHNEIALMIQDAKKQKISKPQLVAPSNLTQATQQKQQSATASAAPSTSYSPPQAAI
jgi:hypothetical protein